MPQDFSGQNLRGRSFKGQNLEGANFSGADIRGADFTRANLRGANFSHVTAGLQRRWAIFLVCLSWMLSGISGLFSAFAGVLISSNSSSVENQVDSWVALIVLILIFIVILRQGFNSAIAGAIAFAFAVAFAAAFVGAFTGAGAIAGAIAIAIAFVIAGAITFAIAFAVAFAGAIAIAFAVAIPFAIPFAGAFAFAFAIAGALVSAYIAWRAMKGDEKYALIRNIAVAFAALEGTKFGNANLTDANFTAAILKSTDFRKANLIRTYFHKTKKLDRVRPGTTYLQNAKVVSVLVTGQGQDLNFDREDLQGVNFQGVNLVDASFIGADLSYANLQGANLVDASFIGADLSQANLQDADLSRAKLKQTQLDATDFTGATLTGAYIQDWGITTDTKFDGVRCEYVYMRLPTKENPDPLRKPDNNKEVFADGEFGDFIKPIFDTLDLYHSQGVDPRAIAVAFKELAENNPSAELEIIAIERRGDDKILLRAKTAATANKSELSKEYFVNYNHLKAIAEKDFQALIAAKEYHINRLETMITTTLERPNFYVETYTNQGDTIMPEGSKKQSNFNLQGAQFAGDIVNAETVTAHQIGGNITNYTTEQKQNLTLAATEIQQLLQQLEKTNPTATTSEKMTVVAKVVDEIEKNPTLKAWVIEALLSGQREALKEAIEHPLANILMASINEWQNERDSLEQAYALQSQKIAIIRNAWVIETDPSRKFQYEQQLQSEERILKKLDDRLNAIKK
ncbi:hypothetical protein NIES2100_73300 [Calothrix sp. NIES-2100]|uniref:pentapeptide repeat-containing protein n=1 Tax=Calothrix sp. NIES-2100 TaxID=1954172 RepID=UPI000B5DD32A|nr:hypothetical protein NIES2100_73300 [Calothrix sp. NIES-2100]